MGASLASGSRFHHSLRSNPCPIWQIPRLWDPGPCHQSPTPASRSIDTSTWPSQWPALRVPAYLRGTRSLPHHGRLEEDCQVWQWHRPPSERRPGHHVIHWISLRPQEQARRPRHTLRLLEGSRRFSHEAWRWKCHQRYVSQISIRPCTSA